MPYRLFSRLWSERVRVLTVVLVALAAGCQERAPVNDATPPGLAAADPSVRARVSVSGLSAGGYMAVQAHIALADRIGGVAAIAAGPYHCAQGSVRTALSLCMSGQDIDVSPFVAFAREQSPPGTASVEALLADAPVWLFRGARDAVIAADVSSALAAFYRTLAPTARVVEVTDIDAAHGWPTLATGGPCAERDDAHYINACNYDAAGALLAHLYGDLAPPPDAAAPPGQIDIAGLVAAGADIADSAYAFVPAGCADNAAQCRLHIAFHGCRQGAQFVGARFASDTGLNRWAAANDIVVLYPQIEKSMGNPQGCWDWWGYSGDDYDRASGAQLRTVAALIDAWRADRLPLSGAAP